MLHSHSNTSSIAIAADKLTAYVSSIFERLGAEAEIAAQLADSLIAADLADRSSHGVRLLPSWVSFIRSGQLSVNAQAQITDDLGAVIRMNGNHALGPIVGRAACALAIERARKYGIALVLARDVGHLGRLAEHTGTLAAADLVGILFCNCQGAGSTLAPAGAAEPRLSNNSLSMAMPNDGTPVLLDMALSIVSQAQVQLVHERDEKLPHAWLLDKNGKPSNDPAVLTDGGSMLPLGGLDAAYKGTGLIILIDLIVGILSGGGVCRAQPGPFRNAFAMIAIDPEPLVSNLQRSAQIEEMREYIKQARRLPGVEEIILPGERGASEVHRRSAEGIPVERVTLARLAQIAQELGLEPLSGQ